LYTARVKDESRIEFWAVSSLKWRIHMNITEAWRDSCPVEYCLGNSMVGFGLPITDMESPQNILDLAADLWLGSVTKMFIHRSPFPDVILEGVHELVVRVFHILGVSYGALDTNEDLDCYLIGVNCRYIEEHRVRRNCFWASKSGDCRIRGSEVNLGTD
jgi:hypothetical protein